MAASRQRYREHPHIVRHGAVASPQPADRASGRGREDIPALAGHVPEHRSMARLHHPRRAGPDRCRRRAHAAGRPGHTLLSPGQSSGAPGRRVRRPGGRGRRHNHLVGRAAGGLRQHDLVPGAGDDGHPGGADLPHPGRRPVGTMGRVQRALDHRRRIRSIPGLAQRRRRCRHGCLGDLPPGAGKRQPLCIDRESPQGLDRAAEPDSGDQHRRRIRHAAHPAASGSRGGNGADRSRCEPGTATPRRRRARARHAESPGTAAGPAAECHPSKHPSPAPAVAA